MEPSVEILNELKQISPFLSDMKRINVFSVPDGYFTNLEKEILENTIIQPQVLQTSEIHTPDVPQGYFENLAGNILQRIKTLEHIQDNELSHYPVLFSIRKTPVFSVLENYFEQLPVKILNRVSTPVKVISLSRRRIWNYAVAASITALMLISSILVKNNASHPDALNQVSSNIQVPAYIHDANSYKNEQQINDAITKLSDEDIIKYLEATGNDEDNDAVASSVKENELPSPADYLANDKTLDTFLNQN